MGWLFFVTWFLIVFIAIFIAYTEGGLSFSDILFGCVIGTLLHILLSLIIMAHLSSYGEEVSSVSERELVQASFSNSIDGNFYLGFGSVKDKPVYIYYYKTADGRYKVARADCSRFTIRESETETPKIVLYKRFKLVKQSGWFVKSWLGSRVHSDFPYAKNAGEFVVPAGTIEKMNFSKLNL